MPGRCAPQRAVGATAPGLGGNGRSVTGKAVVQAAPAAGALVTSDANVATVAMPFGSMRTSHALIGSTVHGETALSWMAL